MKYLVAKPKQWKLPAKHIFEFSQTLLMELLSIAGRLSLSLTE
jgi:hypothetical protein